MTRSDLSDEVLGAIDPKKLTALANKWEMGGLGAYAPAKKGLPKWVMPVAAIAVLYFLFHKKR